METLLLIAIGLLILNIYMSFSQRGKGSGTFEDKLSALQERLINLHAQLEARQSDSQTLFSQINEVKDGLTKLHSYVEARQDIEQQTMESIRRLETVIAGTHSKGVAGENILEVVFAKLPPDWQLRNFRVGGKVVEFALRLPNNLVLPIDSKWTATTTLERFAATDDIAEKQQLKKEIEKQVLSKAEEVRKYIDPNLTTTFGIAVVPDAVYDLCAGVHADVFRLNVVLISYSLFIPYLLLVFQTILKSLQTIDMHKLQAYLQDVQENLDALQSELDGRFDRALTMLNNSRSEMGAHLSRVKGGLTSLQISAVSQSSEDELAFESDMLLDEQLAD